MREHLNETRAAPFRRARPAEDRHRDLPGRRKRSGSRPRTIRTSPSLGCARCRSRREILIEREDFMENAPSKFHRLKPGGEVRLRYGYIIKCERVVKDAAGNVIELHCSHDPASRSGSDESGRKVKGTIHWVSAKHARRAAGAALRSPVLGAVSRRQRRQGAEPRLAEDREPRRARAGVGRGQARGTVSVRAARVISSPIACSRSPARRSSIAP